MRIVLLLPLFITTALGQSVESPCELEPEVKEAFRSWDQMDEAVVPYQERHGRRLKLVQQLLEKYPKDIRVHFWRWELLAGPMGETREAATEEYRRLYAANPDDPIYQFLYASLITGRNRGSDSNGAKSHVKRRFQDSLEVGDLALDPRSRIGTCRRD